MTRRKALDIIASSPSLLVYSSQLTNLIPWLMLKSQHIGSLLVMASSPPPWAISSRRPVDPPYLDCRLLIDDHNSHSYLL